MGAMGDRGKNPLEGGTVPLNVQFGASVLAKE